MTDHPEDKGRLKNKLNEWKLELGKSLISNRRIKKEVHKGSQKEKKI